ncbi:metallophosphoesterase family protein [Microbulbifer taiwanensis]|uniref:Metallophosphoesterase n=1 Tax=Microbulbifer taiwanensis TaxID=986746 RepID=A0ABW1YQ37_9GAMM|nr:metallophosphoesterase family protein [Microbulbifer taiwanensis]
MNLKAIRSRSLSPLLFALFLCTPLASASPGFLVNPYLQSPSADSMTVMFESHDNNFSVHYRALGQGNFQQLPASNVSGSSTVFQAQIDGLVSSSNYEYFVRSENGDTPVYRFRTWPAAGDAVDDFKFIVLSDTQGDWPERFQDIVRNGLIGVECGGDVNRCPENIAAIVIPGDLVTSGGIVSQWRNEFFAMARNISPYVPLIPSIGNHDYNISNYLKYFKLPENGTAGYLEQWYYIDYANLRLIGLNSNTSLGEAMHNAQGQWLDSLLAGTAQSSAIDYVFFQLHHPCKSELWLPGENPVTCDFVQRVEDFSAQTGTITGHLFGHTHAYSRGQSRDVKHLWLNAATSAGDIDFWGEYAQRDYDEFQKSYDEYGYSALTFSAQGAPGVHVQRRSGGDDRDYYGYSDASSRDDFVIGGANTAPNAPVAQAPSGQIDDVAVELQAGAFGDVDGDSHLASHWQVSTAAGDYSNPVVDIWGNKTRSENIWYEMNIQQGVDITRYTVGGLAGNTTYFWRVRYRDEHWEWSDWSQEMQFTTPNLQETGNLVANPGAESGIGGWTVEQGNLESLTQGECNGVSPNSGSRYFSIGGLCSESAQARARQRIDLASYRDAIAGGDVSASFGAYMRNWSGSDLPEIYLEFLDQQQNVIGSSEVISSATTSWTGVSDAERVPENTHAIDLWIRGTRNNGSDNDSYIDDIRLTLLLPDDGGSAPQIPSDNLLANPGAEQGTDHWQVLSGYLESLASGECNGVSPHSGSRYFAVGALCDEAAVAEAMQNVDVSAYAAAIDAGLRVEYAGYMRNWNGNDVPEIFVVFIDAGGQVLDSTSAISNVGTSFALRSNTVDIPAGTRSLEFHLRGTRNRGTDNDSYLDDLSLRLVQ